MKWHPHQPTLWNIKSAVAYCPSFAPSAKSSEAIILGRCNPKIPFYRFFARPFTIFPAGTLTAGPLATVFVLRKAGDLASAQEAYDPSFNDDRNVVRTASLRWGPANKCITVRSLIASDSFWTRKQIKTQYPSCPKRKDIKIIIIKAVQKEFWSLTENSKLKNWKVYLETMTLIIFSKTLFIFVLPFILPEVHV